MISIFRRGICTKLSRIYLAESKCNNTLIAKRISVPTVTQFQPNLSIQRFKSKGKAGKDQRIKDTDTESDGDNEDFEDEITDKHTKVMQVSVKSMRVDGILKAGLGMARNKIETLFYESKIRVNGQKLLKKSALASEGDEIDVVKGISAANKDFLTVARVEVLGIAERGDTYNVKIRRCKSLTIENYDEQSKHSPD